MQRSEALVESYAMSLATIRKLDHRGDLVAEYQGRVIRRSSTEIVIQATWARRRQDLGFVVLEPGDLLTEHFYQDRWYNVFAIRTNRGRLKGWYCNFTRPARIASESVCAEDLALDLWVSPCGQTFLLDEDEYEALPLARDEQLEVRAAVESLTKQVAREAGPFSGLRGSRRDGRHGSKQ